MHQSTILYFLSFMLLFCVITSNYEEFFNLQVESSEMADFSDEDKNEEDLFEDSESQIFNLIQLPLFTEASNKLMIDLKLQRYTSFLKKKNSPPPEFSII